MALDQYSICPCGSGKKIKFCKCHDHLAEMVKLDRMIQGDQSVAALDHINHLMKSLPSEPWLLAMKCELLLKLQEAESLEETSAKFIRLQPDNPLAKLFRSFVALMRGNVEEAASLLLQAVGGNTGSAHPMIISAFMNVIESLLQRRWTLSALTHSELLLGLAADNENLSEIAERVYNTVITEDRAAFSSAKDCHRRPKPMMRPLPSAIAKR